MALGNPCSRGRVRLCGPVLLMRLRLLLSCLPGGLLSVTSHFFEWSLSNCLDVVLELMSANRAVTGEANLTGVHMPCSDSTCDPSQREAVIEKWESVWLHPHMWMEEGQPSGERGTGCQGDRVGSRQQPLWLKEQASKG